MTGVQTCALPICFPVTIDVVTGDLAQADRPTENGLLDFCRLYSEKDSHKLIDMVRFESKDIERHPVVKEILAIYKETD